MFLIVFQICNFEPFLSMTSTFTYVWVFFYSSKSTMEKLPEEMLRAVFVYLPGSDRLPVSLTCRRWFNLLKDSVPSIKAVHISLDTSACSTRFLEASLSEAALSICLCPGHAQKHAVLLQPLFQAVGKKLATLAVEDNLIPKASLRFIIKLYKYGSHYVDKSIRWSLNFRTDQYLLFLKIDPNICLRG